jgi:hypothetical protein
MIFLKCGLPASRICEQGVEVMTLDAIGNHQRLRDRVAEQFG